MSSRDSISISRKLRLSLNKLETEDTAKGNKSPDMNKHVVEYKGNYMSNRHRRPLTSRSVSATLKPVSKRIPNLYLPLSVIKHSSKASLTEGRDYEYPKTYVTESAQTHRSGSVEYNLKSTPNSPRKTAMDRAKSQFYLETIINQCESLEDSNKRETDRIREEDKNIKSAYKHLSGYIEKPNENLNEEYIHRFVKEFKSDKIAFVYGKGNQGLYLRANNKNLIKLL